MATTVPSDLAGRLDRWLADERPGVESGPLALLAWLFEVYLARLSDERGLVVSWRALSCDEMVVAEQYTDRIVLDLAATFERTVAYMDGLEPPRRTRHVVTSLDWRLHRGRWGLWDEAIEGRWRSAQACVGRVTGRSGPVGSTRVGLVRRPRPIAWVEFTNDTDDLATILERTDPSTERSGEWSPRRSELQAVLTVLPRSPTVVPVSLGEGDAGWLTRYVGEVSEPRRHLERLDVPLHTDDGHLEGRGWCIGSRTAADAW